ncbi:MAG: hypothetical protein EA406_05330 [Rhodospirillales bacterium]|nr:MAG: hypothetical protein EA406_05330 [Rhodospirillales bacterium]
MRLGAEMDPSFPNRVERVLARNGEADTHGLTDGHDLGTFLVTAAHIACGIHAALIRRTDRPARVFVEERLRREMGIDEGMSPDHDSIIDAVADAVLR